VIGNTCSDLITSATRLDYIAGSCTRTLRIIVSPRKVTQRQSEKFCDPVQRPSYNAHLAALQGAAGVICTPHGIAQTSHPAWPDFSDSLSALPAHAARAHGASRTTHLCVPLVTHFALNFAGGAQGHPHGRTRDSITSPCVVMRCPRDSPLCASWS
jgi:hypothetical protein